MCSAIIKVPHVNKMKKVVEQVELRVKVSMARPVLLPTFSSNILPPPSEEKKRKEANTLEKLFNRGAKEELDAIITMLFSSDGLPFNLARNPYYAMTFTYTANNLIADYITHG